MFDIVLGVAYSLALVWVVVGTFYRVGVWLKARQRFNIALAPAPRSRTGVMSRLILEIFVFRSLARASRLTWFASMAMHYGLLWVLIVHLRFIFDTLPLFLLPFIQLSAWASACLFFGVGILLLRRLLVDRIRYISAPSDYLHLLLLLAIVASGALLKRVRPVNLYEVNSFLNGVFSFNWVSLPDHLGLIMHLMLVLLLLLVFPVSKLLHGVGIVFTPTFTQRDEK